MYTVQVYTNGRFSGSNAWVRYENFGTHTHTNITCTNTRSNPGPYKHFAMLMERVHDDGRMVGSTEVVSNLKTYFIAAIRRIVSIYGVSYMYNNK